jgi:hypothetical protein
MVQAIRYAKTELTMPLFLTRRAMGVTPILCVALLSGCHATDHTATPNIVGYNHTDHDIGSFFLNSQGGAFVKKHARSEATCCLAIPRVRDPDMTVTVTWTNEDSQHSQSRILTVRPYFPDDHSEWHVHFLHNGRIKVFVTSIHRLDSPDYPLQGQGSAM